MVPSPTPERIKNWPLSRIHSACSLVATGVDVRVMSSTRGTNDKGQALIIRHRNLPLALIMSKQSLQISPKSTM